MVHEKQVIEEVSGWLRVFEDGSVDRTWTGPPEVKFMAEPFPPHDDYIDGVAVKDVVADENSGSRLRIYLPERKDNSVNKLPVILHFHGGGFCISQADWFMYYTVYTRLARVANAIIVSVFLPLAPEHRLPSACDAGFSALLWLRDLSLQQGHEPWLNDYADFNRVFLIGDSSGGNIVHQVAVRAGEENLSPMRLAGAIPIHPGFVRSYRSKSELEQEQTPFLTLDMVDKFLGLALPVGSNKDHPITCPMGDAAPAVEELNLPPYLYCVAEKDLIKDTEMEFYEAMKKGKKDVELFINSNGVGHSFYLNKISVEMDPVTGSETEKLFEAVAEFISKH
ncbi:strigolactones hydrolase CXE15 [Nicotiana tabacum]|uniref:Probable carboxylesterase 15 n=1 Tax=Nicotiana tabacum TaxID=4097 RepID=A0A1S4A8J3_TOBAC|nr:PREDICTED: probable carboxylesterase 15 [Nicotiana tabacum]XP_018623985.1 probable carboxylesterase 15 [Nicotiana tomentosiformis]